METNLQAVIDRVIADFELATGERANSNQVIEALIGSYGGAAHALYRYIDNRLLQMFPNTANEEWLAIWAQRSSTPRKKDEDLESWRARIIYALDPQPRIGRAQDLVFWATGYDTISFAYPLSNQRTGTVAGQDENWLISGYQKAFGYASLVLGTVDNADGTELILSDAEKDTIRLSIQNKMPAGSFLFVKQSARQLVNFIISGASAEDQNGITRVLTNLFIATNSNVAAVVTVEQIHQAIQTIISAADYELIAPAAQVSAITDNHLRLGEVVWRP